jgi:hypothetical protein
VTEVQITRGADPEPEELAAIIAAVSTVLSSGAGPAPATGDHEFEGARWRFSGRWWSKPIASRRDRPSSR